MLNEPALVLNRNWVAVATTTVRTALIMVYRGSARVIDPDSFEVFNFEEWECRPAGSRSIRTPHLRIAVPEIVLLDAFDGHPSRSVPFSRRNLYRRDAHRCQYCGRHFPPRNLSIDHITPRCRGGRTNWENCVLACIPCNLRKADRPPAASGMRLIRPPKRPKWDPCLGISRTARQKSWDRFLGTSNAAVEEACE